MNSELFASITTLKKLYSSTTKSFDSRSVEPIHIKRFKEELSKKIEGSGTVKPNIDLNALYSILVQNYKNKTLDFTVREKNNLPFILFRSSMPNAIFSYLVENCIDLDRESRLVKVLYNFFYSYEENNERIILLKKKLWKHFSGHAKNDFRKKITKAVYECRNILFSDDTTGKVIEQYKEYGWSQTLEALGLQTPELKKSKFVSQTLFGFYRTPDITQKKFDIFEELENISFLGFLDLKPVAVSSVIRMTDKINNVRWKEKLITFCQRNFGDPRINRYNWSPIDDDARKIFLKWMASKDLDLFFRIIEETAVDRMWRYRSAFWKAYLPYVTNTWVFFGSTAQITARSIAKDQMLAFGRATGGAKANHSAFIFEIGNYTFCEWSHDGKLYIWRNSSSAIQKKIVEFGSSVINKNNVTNSDWIQTFVHSSADTYNWQQQVGDWIASHCNIYKTRKDWRV